MPTYESREAQLTKRISDLEGQIHKLEDTIRTLQNLLYDRQEKVQELTERVRLLEAGMTQSKPSLPANKKPSLVLAVGQDKMLQIDIAKLRGIKKLQLSVLQDATKKDVETIIEERRSQGRPIKYLHFATHSGPEGVLFADGLADGMWLSQTLKDVSVLLIAGCKSHRVASLLSVISFIVSMRDDIDNADASTFSYHFWFAIGEGFEPEEAYYYAIERSNSIVSEMAEFHSY
jgi:uncharacterized coiled-coil protein SlyX